MSSLSSPLAAGFVVLSLALAVGFVVAVWWAGNRAHDPWRQRRTRTIRAAVGTTAWLVGTAGLAASGHLTFGPTPPPLLLLMAVLVVVLTLLVHSELGTRLATTLPLWVLVGYQGFRIGVELMLHQAWLQGLIPVRLTYLGWNFDIATGTSAVIVATLVWLGRAPRWLVAGWNLVGFGLLLTIVTLSILSSPVPFRVFFDEPAVVWITAFPWVWLPTVMVTAALLGHLLVWRSLALGRHR